MKHVAWIYRVWKPHLWFLPILLVFTVLAVVVGVGYPLVLRELVGASVELTEKGRGEALDDISKLIGILLLVGLGRSLRNLYPMTRAWVNSKLEMEVRRAYFARVVEKGHGFFHKFRTGDIVTRLTDDIAGWMKIGWFLCSGIFRAVESGTTTLVCMIFMVLVDWRLALVALAPLPVMITFFFLAQTRLGERIRRNQRVISDTNDFLESCYSGVRIVKAYRAEPRQAERLRAVLGERIEIEMRLVKMWALLESLFQTLTNSGQILTIAFGGYWVIKGELALEDFFVIYVWVEQLTRPMWDIPNLFVAGKQAFICIDRLEEMSDYDRGGEDRDDVGEPVDRIQSIELEGASFRFADESLALEGLDLSIPMGRKVAVVGPIGSGKSTLARILAGELSPTTGRILVNGRDRGEADIADYRRRIGYIPQEALLFSDTVRENVSFGRPMPDLNVRDALTVAQMEEEVAAFPKGLDEMLGQRGVRVSGGQRQRLAIARAVAGAPDVLVMDDVTAALDAENEELLWDALTERHPDLSAVLITHRMATARRADEIVVLDGGRMIDRGTHDDLLTRCDLYRRLAHQTA